MFYVSHVTCHVSHITYLKIFIIIFLVEKNIKFIYKIKLKKLYKNGENYGAIYLKVCYQQGISCLVLYMGGISQDVKRPKNRDFYPLFFGFS